MGKDFEGKRLGFLGGSFDPVHHGHLIMARDVLEELKLDQVFFVPARRNPLKEEGPIASAADRVAMLESAIKGILGLDVLTLELERKSFPSYTFDTVQELTKRFPGAELYWIIGADQAGDLHRWARIDDLARIARFAVVERPGYETAVSHGAVRWDPVRGHAFDISSTEVRERCQKGMPVDFFLPQSVVSIIGEKEIYTQH